MIVPYYGEFLVSPAPLELSLNWCSHNCAYCFANLNDPTRTGDPKQVMRFLARYNDADTLEAQLLQHGYPTVVSNRADPFALSNEKHIIPIIRAMQGLNLPVVIQTKGGRKALETAKWLKPSVWYISIESDTDALSKLLAPGAPPTSERLQLIRDITAIGHRVVVGVNPCVEEWIKNPIAFLQTIKTAGAEGVWVESLHLSRDQTKNLTTKQEAALTAPIIEFAMKKVDEYTPFVHDFREHVVAEGMEVFSMGQGNASAFFRPYAETYDRVYPTQQAMVNMLHRCMDQDGTDEVVLDWDEFRDMNNQHLPELSRCRLGHLLTAKSRTMAKVPGYSNWLDWESVLKLTFALPAAPANPSHVSGFGQAFDEDTREPLVMEGMPRYIFRR